MESEELKCVSGLPVISPILLQARVATGARIVTAHVHASKRFYYVPEDRSRTPRAPQCNFFRVASRPRRRHRRRRRSTSPPFSCPPCGNKRWH